MTEAQVRAKVIEQARTWLGIRESNNSHRPLVDLYNSQDPLPVGYRLSYSDSWCAAYITVVGLQLNYLDIILAECSCTRMTELYRKKGRYVSDPNYKPSIGDIVMIETDGNRGNGMDHVGFVTGTNGNAVYTIEGNCSDSCCETTRYPSEIHGYCLPDYASKAQPAITPITGNIWLTMEQMQNNAKYIYSYLYARGWTLNAIAGLLGNMQTESHINPGIWQNLDEGNTDLGYGLVQWTPATKYLNWCADRGLEPSDMDSALQRIEYELENGLQYYKTDDYPLTFREFKTSTKDPFYLGMAFVHNYERPANITDARGTQAEYWYEYLSNYDPDIPVVPGNPVRPPWTGGSKKGLPLWLLVCATQRK